MNDKKHLRDLRRANRKLDVHGREVWLTGYSDASYSPKGNLGGWGVWVRDSSRRIHRAGPCPDWIVGSQDAELCGVWAAVHTALTHLDHETANILVVKTDCQNVAKYFGWGSGNFPKDPNSFRLVCQAFAMTHERGIRLVVTWVKGHQGTGTTKGYLNEQVDQMAGVARRDGKKVLRVFTI